MRRKSASNQIPVLKNALGLAIKNGNSSVETLAVDNQEMYHNEIVMENQNVMKNTNTDINLEVADNTKNGNTETPKIGNELPMGLESIEKQTSIDLNLEKIGELKNGNSTTVKNGNTPINDPNDEDDTMKNANNIRTDNKTVPKNGNVLVNSCPDSTMMSVETPNKGTSIQAPVDNLVSQDDDSDDDTVIYTSDPECDQNKKTDIGDSEPTNGKPRLSKQISINLNRLTSEEISSWQSNDLPAIDTQSPSLK